MRGQPNRLTVTDWIVGMLTVQAMTPAMLEETIGRRCSQQLMRLRRRREIRIVRWLRCEVGWFVPLYRRAHRDLPDAARPPALSNAAKLRRQRARQPKRPDARRVASPKSRSQICREYRARKKVRVASVFEWRGPLKENAA